MLECCVSAGNRHKLLGKCYKKTQVMLQANMDTVHLVTGAPVSAHAYTFPHHCKYFSAPKIRTVNRRASIMLGIISGEKNWGIFWNNRMISGNN